MKLCINPELGVYCFDDSQVAESYLCEIPTLDDTRPIRLVLPAALTKFIREFDGIQETEDIINTFVTNNPDSISSLKLKQLISQYLLPKGLLVRTDSAFQRAAPLHGPRSYVRFQCTLLPARIVSRLSSILRWLFDWHVFFCILPLVAGAEVLFFGQTIHKFGFNIVNLGGLQMIQVALIASIFGLFHELGHAAALARFGSTRASVGWGLYIVWTVFYTDLSDAWRYSRMQRAMVDLGGIYFHSLSLIFLLCLIYLTHCKLLIYCFFCINFQILSSLNPFLRADAFWLFSDLFGIPNLRDQSLGMLEKWVYAALRIRRPPLHRMVSLSPSANAFLGIYTIVIVGFYVYCSQIFLRQLIGKVLPAYPSTLKALWTAIYIHHIDLLSIFDIALSLVWKTLALVGLFFFLMRIVRGTYKIAIHLTRSDVSMRSQAMRPTVQEE